MKKITIIILVFVLTIVSCQKEQIQINIDESSVQPSPSLNKGIINYPNNEMIVKYKTTTSEIDKEVLRKEYGVINFKTCDCADPTIELWEFSTDSGISVEEHIVTAKTDSGLEGADFNPTFQHNGGNLFDPFGVENINIALGKVVAENENITIAILDSGVDYNYFGFSNPFLYNNTNNPMSCSSSNMTDYYGWDFVNQDNDPFDDFGHGTIITNIITNKLESENIPFQILPIKAFDATGKGSYFDILCGFKYALNNEDVDVINMSFGWYGDSYELLDAFINESKDQVLITTSAGNNAVNTDIIGHFPSAFSSPNILAVTSLDKDLTNINLASFANFGINTVDIAAKGENIAFDISPTETIYVAGTSYSNAYATATSGLVFDINMSVEQHKLETISKAIFNANLNEIKHSSFLGYDN